MRKLIYTPFGEKFNWNRWDGYDFEYDEKGRLTKYTHVLSSNYYSLTYSGNNVILRDSDPDYDTSGYKLTFQLNKQGYAISAISGHAGSESGTTKFTYSPEGYLISAEGKVYKETFIWKNGNLIESKRYDLEDKDVLIFTYTYDSNKPNPYGIMIANFQGYYKGNEVFYAGIFGKATKNLLSSYTKTYTAAPGSSDNDYTMHSDKGCSYTLELPKEEDDTSNYTFPLYYIE